MARKNSEGKGSGTNRPGLRVVDSSARAGKSDAETIFGESRSGRDRREDEGAVADSRRTASERRKSGRVTQSAWWLERDYVESHHFVQKSSSTRILRRDEDEAAE